MHLLPRRFTKGPWYYEESDDPGSPGYFISGENSALICSIRAWYDHAEANRDLVVAAPALLDALIDLVERTVERDMARGVELDPETIEAYDTAVKVIDKAFGMRSR